MPEVIDLLAEVREEIQSVHQISDELTRLKDVGNSHFKNGEFTEAVSTYKSALEVARNGWRDRVKTTAEAKAVINPLLVSLHCNLAAVHLKRAPLSDAPLEAYSAAEVAASAALSIDAAHVKALYRRGVARAELGMIAGAKDDLLAACRADPKDRTARAELERVQAALSSQRAGTSRDVDDSPSAFAPPPAQAVRDERDAARQREKAQVRAAASAAVDKALAGKSPFPGAT